jgi:hypothetical protein
MDADQGIRTLLTSARPDRMASSVARNGRPIPLARFLRGARLLVLGAAVLLGAGACSSSTTDPSAPSKPATPAPVLLPEAAVLAEMFDDATTRIVPALPEGAAREEMAASLATLTAAVQAGIVGPAKAALTTANAAVAKYSIALGGDADGLANLDAIHISLDYLAAVIAAVSGG